MNGGCGPCPFFSYTLAFAVQLRKARKTSVRVVLTRISPGFLHNLLSFGARLTGLLSSNDP
jgi:hypothetical protein